MTGIRHGRLVGTAYSHSEKGHAFWHFACDCGQETIVNGSAVRAGKTASCGCLHREICRERLTVHGRRAWRQHDATYRTWQEINSYCSNPSSPRYRDFGALGVEVCCRWKADFPAFVTDMGERPEGRLIGITVDADHVIELACDAVRVRCEHEIKLVIPGKAIRVSAAPCDEKLVEFMVAAKEAAPS